MGILKFLGCRKKKWGAGRTGRPMNAKSLKFE